MQENIRPNQDSDLPNPTERHPLQAGETYLSQLEELKKNPFDFEKVLLFFESHDVGPISVRNAFHATFGDYIPQRGWTFSVIAAARNKYPQLVLDIASTDNFHRRVDQLWTDLNTYSKLATLVNEYNVPSFYRTPNPELLSLKAAKERLEMHEHDEKCYSFIIRQDLNQSSYEVFQEKLSDSQKKEQAPFQAAAERLTNDPLFPKVIMEQLQRMVLPTEHIKELEDRIYFYTIEVDGIPIPIVKKTSSNSSRMEKERTTIQQWQEHDPVSFEQSSALQTVRSDGIWMVDLGRLGFRENGFIDHFKLVDDFNLYTHPGRLLLLQYLTQFAEWLTTMEHFCAPSDVFPRSLWTKILPDNTLITRANDLEFGKVRNKPEICFFVWFGDGQDKGIIGQIPPLSHIEEPRLRSTLISSSPLLNLCKTLEAIQVAPYTISHQILWEAFSAALVEYQQNIELYRSVGKEKLDLIDAIHALNILSSHEKEIIVMKIKSNASNKSTNPDYNLAYAFSFNLDSPTGSRVLMHVARFLRCSLNTAKQLLDHIPYQERIELIKKWDRLRD